MLTTVVLGAGESDQGLVSRAHGPAFCYHLYHSSRRVICAPKNSIVENFYLSDIGMQGDTVTLDFTVHSYGSSVSGTEGNVQREDRRTTVELKPVVPRAFIQGDQNGLTKFIKGAVYGIQPEIKYSNQWHCQFCSEYPLTISLNLSSPTFGS